MLKFLVYGLPILLLGMITASFLNVASLKSDKKNEMAIGLLGEPSTLNPIKSADAAASSVQDSLFNSLLKYDANLEVIPDLASEFSLSQQTTFFFPDEDSALSGLLRLEGHREQWTAWTLKSVRMCGHTLELHFSEPGMDASGEIAGLIEDTGPLPLQVVRIDGPLPPELDLTQLVTAGGRVVRTWKESSSGAELTVTGAPDTAIEEVKEMLPEGLEISVREQLGFLAEPRVRFLLRDDVRWHDGAPFTSADPAFTYHAIMDEAVASPRKPDFDTILKVETPGPHEFVVTYRRPYSPALNSWMIPVIPAHLLSGKPQEWWVQHFDRSPIGTGPFRFDQWKTNEFLRVVRNPDYFRAPAPWLEAVVYRILSDQLALRLAFETGQVDFWGVDPWAVSSFEKDERFDLYSMPGNSYTYVGWNLRRPLFADLRVRKALAHAVNIPEMVQYILYGRGVQSTGIFTPQMWFFDPDVRPIPYDPERARSLLAEAGWKPGPDGILEKDGQRFTFTLITNSGNEIRRDIATLFQDNLKAIGIDVDVETYEWAVFLRNFINKGNFDAMVLGWALGLDFDQYQIWHSSQSNPEQLNVVGYNNPKVDRLLEQIRQEYSRPKIIRLASEIQQTVYADQPYLFLYVPESTSVLWKDSFRVLRPFDGEWVDTPILMTKAGWSYYSDYFYRPEFPPVELDNGRPTPSSSP